MPWELADLMGAEHAAQALQRLQPLCMLARLLQPDPGTARGRVSVLESGMYLRNQLLRDADWAGMAHGVEIRTPLVDIRLLHALAPAWRKRSGGTGKDMLATVPARPLPAAMLGRAKTGFQVPLQSWLSKHGGTGKQNMPAHVTAIRDWSRRVASAR